MNNQKMDTFLRSYYQSQNLAPEKLEQLLLFTQTEALPEPSGQNASKSNPERNRTAQRHWHKTLAFTAAIVILLTGGWVMRHFFSPPHQLGQLVAREISVNHNKQLDVEYTADTFSALKPQMGKLDFEIIAPKRMAQTKYHVVGGRYCTINGQIAAQIKLKDPNGKIMTLYQTRISAALNAIPEQKTTIDGVQVQQWQENGLFFGLAQSPQIRPF